MLQLTNAGVTYPAGNMLQKLRGALMPKKYAKDRARALNDVTLWLGRGESFAVLGAPGSGKSTLLRLAAGKIPVSVGHCSVEGKVASAIRGEDSLIETDTGEQNVLLCCKLLRMSEAEIAARLLEVEQLAALGEHFRKRVETYDEAMRARLCISMALSARPDILVISNMLERCALPYTQRYVVEIRNQVRQGLTLLLFSPDSSLMQRLCESAIWMANGGIHKLGLFETVYAAYAQPHLAEEKKQEPVPQEQTPQDSTPEEITSRDSAMQEITSQDSTQQELTPHEWLEQQQAAFSEQLAPDWDAAASQGSPPSVPDLEYELRRLSQQLTAYARANLAYDEENQRLRAALQLERVRAKETVEQLRRMLAAASDSMRALHKQFEELMEHKQL